MKVKELQELLEKVSKLPGGSDREVVFLGSSFQHVCAEQVIPCNIQIGVDYSFELTPSLLIHDWHTTREEYLEDCDGHVIKPNRDLYSSPRHADIKYNSGPIGPRGGSITKAWKEKHEKDQQSSD